MKTPTIGSQVRFVDKQRTLCVATIAAVHTQNSVNLSVLDPDGGTYPVTKVAWSPNKEANRTWHWPEDRDNTPPTPPDKPKASAGKTAVALILGALLLLTAFSSRAADYGIQKTFYAPSATLFTNTPGTATNINAAMDCTQITDFALHVRAACTNVMGGSIDIRWSTSLDGVNFANATNPPAAGAGGWFSVPLTNSGVFATWTTNITVNAVGYWRIDYITNNAFTHVTNMLVRGYAKPKRQNRDY